MYIASLKDGMYTQAIAEESQDKILSQVRTSTGVLEEVLASNVHNAALCITVVLVILLMTLIIVSLVLFVYLDIIPVSKALIALVITSLYVTIISAVFVGYASDYTLKRARAAGEVFNNYISSESAVEAINGAALAYKSAAM